MQSKINVIVMIIAALLSSCGSIKWDRLPDEIVIPIPKPSPDDPDPARDDFPAGLVWLHTDVSAWPVTSVLDSVSVDGRMIHMPYDKANVWPGRTGAGTSANVNANPWIIANHDGTWYAVTWEWMRPGQTSKSQSAVTGSKMSGPMRSFRPVSGEEYGFFISGLARAHGRNNKERTQVVWFTWP